MIAEQQRRHHDQIVKIDRVISLEHALIDRISLGNQHFLRTLRLIDRVFRRDQVVLQIRDCVLHQIDHIAIVAVIALHDVTNDAFAVVLVENRKAGFITRCRQLVANDIQAKVVESRDRQTTGTAFAGQAHHPLFHFTGSLVGKGNRGNVMRLDAAGIDQISDFACDHAGLARASPGQYQQGAVDVFRGFFLTGIKLG